MSGDDSPPQIGLVRMGEHDVVPLKEILRRLKIMANNIRNKSCLDEIKKQLKSCNYGRWLGDNPDERQMMKALAVAVNQAVDENIEKKIELADESSEKVNQELYDLLARGYENNVSPDRYFVEGLNLSESPQITSPCVLAEVCLKSNAPQWVVASMIQRQFDIKWDTLTGEPADYSFYDFCNTKFFVYKTRQAHVRVTLYKEYCEDPKKYKEILDDPLHFPENTLCPEVYFSTINGWKSWQAHDEEHNETEEFREVIDFPEWIDKDILKFITKHADTQTLDDESLKNGKTNPLEKPCTLYWAVINDRDFPSDEDKRKRLELKPIGQTQVYVGKAKYGIKHRWLKNSKSHCKMMKKCLNNVCAMTTYDPLRLEEIQLVDARLALAKVRGEETALFVMKTFGDDLEKLKNDLQRAEARLDEARKEWQKTATGAGEKKKLTAAVEKQEKEMKKAKDILKSKETEAKEDPEKLLEDIEKLHREGKKDGGKSLIITDNEEWKPKDMKYGMNHH